jgi:hypothetical protein
MYMSHIHSLGANYCICCHREQMSKSLIISYQRNNVPFWFYIRIVHDDVDGSGGDTTMPK